MQRSEPAQVLLVDDDPAKLLSIETILDIPEHRMIQVSSGRDALRYLLSHDVAVILLDVNMPGMDGFETAALIRQRRRSAHTPIIFISAISPAESYAARGYSLGAVDYIFTPIVPEVLQAKVAVFIDLFNKTEALRDQTEMLSRLNIELERANRAKDQFLASMSHELRTPLNAIIGFTGTLLMGIGGTLTAEQERQLHHVQSSAHHLLSLINDVLDLAKIESGKLNLNYELVVCHEVITEVVATLRPLAEAKGLALDIVMSEQTISVWTDRRAFSQILINLVGNAIKFTEQGGVRVELNCRRRDKDAQAEISIIDTGIGIKPEDQARLFQAFAQIGGSAARRSEGTGMGLYLSQKLATLLGGAITVTSTAGQGSTFTLTLPIVDMLHTEV